MPVQSMHFQFMVIAPPIGILFREVHLDPSAFDSTNFVDDWVNLTPPFGDKLNVDDFEPLAALLFCQSYLTRYNLSPHQPLSWSRSNQTFPLLTVVILVTSNAHFAALP